MQYAQAGNPLPLLRPPRSRKHAAHCSGTQDPEGCACGYLNQDWLGWADLAEMPVQDLADSTQLLRECLVSVSGATLIQNRVLHYLVSPQMPN